MECTRHSKHKENDSRGVSMRVFCQKKPQYFQNSDKRQLPLAGVSIASVLLPVIQAVRSSMGASYLYLKVPPTAKHENLADTPQRTSSQPQDQQPQQALGSVECEDTLPLGPHRLRAGHGPRRSLLLFHC